MKRWYKQGIELLGQIQSTRTTKNEVVLWYLGQCGFMIRWNDVSILIDPLLSDLADHDGSSLRLYHSPFLPEMCCCDYILCTHKHADHMARETILPILDQHQNSRIMIPESCVSVLQEWGVSLDRIIVAEEKKEVNLDHFRIMPISTAHPTHNRDEQGRIRNVAYAIQLDEIIILHLGDTYLTEQLWNDLKEISRIDILMVPINGRDYYRESQGIIGNMEPEEAARLAADLGADLAIPMHYDMIRGNTADPIRFIRSYMEITNSGAKWKLPALGEQIIYRKN